MASTLARRPLFDFGDMPMRVDRLLEDLIGNRQTEGSWTAALDVQHVEGGLKLEVEMPGIKLDDVKITVEDGVLTVSGETEKETEDKRDGYVRRERRYGSFRRSMPLPQGADAEKIAASGKDGVVEIMVPVAEPARPAKVEITPKAA